MTSLVKKLLTEKQAVSVGTPGNDYSDIEFMLRNDGFLPVRILNTDGDTTLGIEVSKWKNAGQNDDQVVAEGTLELDFQKLDAHVEFTTLSLEGTATFQTFE